jgi:ferritin-like metal-binding protein YciE
LQDIYYAKHQIEKALPDMIENAALVAASGIPAI